MSDTIYTLNREIEVDEMEFDLVAVVTTNDLAEIKVAVLRIPASEIYEYKLFEENAETEEIISITRVDEWLEDNPMSPSITRDDLMKTMTGEYINDRLFYIVIPDDPEYLISRAYRGESLASIEKQMRTAGWNIL